MDLPPIPTPPKPPKHWQIILVNWFFTWVTNGLTLLFVFIVVSASTLTVADVWFSESGYVRRADLRDVRMDEALSGFVIQGMCDRVAGRIKVSTVGLDAESAWGVLAHEWWHCYEWPRLSEEERGLLESAYQLDVWRGATDVVNADEWGATEFQKWCEDGVGSPVVRDVSGDALELWGCIQLG